MHEHFKNQFNEIAVDIRRVVNADHLPKEARLKIMRGIAHKLENLCDDYEVGRKG